MRYKVCISACVKVIFFFLAGMQISSIFLTWQQMAQLGTSRFNKTKQNVLRPGMKLN
jgi:hypothetical protein